MANLGKTGLIITNLKERTTTRGKSFLIYGPSGNGKTRSLGTLEGETIHISLDNGASSAMNAAELHEVGGTHREVLVKDVHELAKTVDFLLTDTASKKLFDHVVVDNLVEVGSQIYSILASSKKYKKDQFQIEDIIAAKAMADAENKKGLALHKDTQEQTRNLVKKLQELTVYYNLIVLTADKEVVYSTQLTSRPVPVGIYPYINGPSSITPMTMLFDEVYLHCRKDKDIDVKGDIKTKFKISTFNDNMSGKRCYAKTRAFTGDYIIKGEAQADFRIVLKHTGYILKQDRKQD